MVGEKVNISLNSAEDDYHNICVMSGFICGMGTKCETGSRCGERGQMLLEMA